MSPRPKNVFPYFAASLLVCVPLICTSAPAFAQTTVSFGEQAQEAQSVSGTSPTSDQAPKTHNNPSEQSEFSGWNHPGQCLKAIGHNQPAIGPSPFRMAPRVPTCLIPFPLG